MAIYHFNVSMVSRSKGHNVIAKASYINATRMENHETGQISDYSKKGDVIHTEISLPSHAQQEFKDSQTLWNSVLEVEKSKNSQLARRGDFALPLELSKEERIQLAREYIENTFVKSGMCVEWAYHDKPGNPHIDFIATVRPLKENGKWDAKKRSEFVLDKDGKKIPLIDPKTGEQKTRVRKGKGTEKLWVRKDVETTDWNKRETLEHWREEWANHCNKYLERHEHHEKLDHRSFERQGVDKIPTIHEGYNARKMERQGNVSERCEENRSIKSANKELSKLSAERTNNELLTQIQLGYQKYQVINCIESANKIINDPIKSNNEHDMKLAQRYIDTAEKNINKIYQDMNKLPGPIQDKYANDLQAIDLLKQIHETVIYENTHMKETDVKQEKETQATVKQEPPKDMNVIAREYYDLEQNWRSNRIQLEILKEDCKQPESYLLRRADGIEEVNKNMHENINKLHMLEKQRENIKGWFKGKEKEKLDHEISWYKNRIKVNENELKELGVEDISKPLETAQICRKTYEEQKWIYNMEAPKKEFLEAEISKLEDKMSKLIDSIPKEQRDELQFMVKEIDQQEKEKHISAATPEVQQKAKELEPTQIKNKSKDKFLSMEEIKQEISNRRSKGVYTMLSKENYLAKHRTKESLRDWSKTKSHGIER